MPGQLTPANGIPRTPVSPPSGGTGSAPLAGRRNMRTSSGHASTRTDGRPAGAASVVAFAAVQELANGIHMACVPGGLLDHVDHDPAQGGGRVAEIRVQANLVERMGRDDLVG